MNSVRLGKIFGFEINIDWSWLIIFFLVVYTLAVGGFPLSSGKLSPADRWIMGVVAALLLFTSVLIHELSHSVVARRYGTDVRGITLFLFGGVSQTSDEPKSANEEFWMALVGPLTSFALGIIFYMFAATGALFGWPLTVVTVANYLGFINILLGGFNLVPGFPLDGGRVLRSIIWGATHDLDRATRYAAAIGQAVGYLLMGFGFVSILSGNLIGGLWFVFIGWFLAGAARSSYQQLRVRQALTGVRVEQVMTTDVPPVPADISLRRFVDDDLLHHEYSCYPVIQPEDQSVIGVIGAEEVRAVPSSEWERVLVGQVAHKIGDAYRIAAEDDAWEALSRLASEKICRLLVVEDGHLKGTVGRDSLFRLVQTKMGLSP